MKKTFFQNKKIILVIAVITVAAIAVSLFLPNIIKTEFKNYNYSKGTTAAYFNKADFDIPVGNGIAYVNSKNGDVAIFSSDGKTVFSALNMSAAGNSLSTVIDIRLRDKKGNAYSLNSYDNSVLFNTFKVNNKNGVVSIEYTMFSDDEMVKTKESLAVITLVLQENNGKLEACVDLSAVKLSKGFLVEKLSIMPGLFSILPKTHASYIIPDGCGAKINLNTITEKSLLLNLGVYGNDISFYDYSEGALLPFFAVNQNGALLNCIIEAGDAVSEITCKKHAEGGGYLYNTFTVTPCSTADGKFTKGVSYKGIVTQSYILTENDSSYSTVAAQVRDSLQQKNYLSSSLNKIPSDLPFYINVVGSTDGERALTTFENATEITALLKSRGVRNIALRYSGFDKNGLKNNLKDRISFSNALGGENAFKVLCDELVEQGNTAYLDANILNLSQDEKARFNMYEQTSKLCGVLPEGVSNASVEDISEKTSANYKLATNYNASSLCLTDGATLLFSDAENSLTRSDTLSLIKESTKTLGAAGGLMLSYPAVYLAKEAESVFCTPSTASCDGFTGVESVPVLQIVLHGNVVYGSSLINVTNLSSEDAFLKCVEYGAVPSFVFTHSGETAISYSSYSTQVSKLYTRAKQLLPVINMEITSHEKVTDGVYKIVYDYSKIVYVNYNPSVVEINGVMISAKDFIII